MVSLVAIDGVTAVAALERNTYDCIIVDLDMPGIDGIETLARIREQHADLPVVMLSVVGRAATIVRAMPSNSSGDSW